MLAGGYLLFFLKIVEAKCDSDMVDQWVYYSLAQYWVLNLELYFIFMFYILYF